jgi:hypothetical protein
MTLLPRGVKVHLAFGFIDMRKGIDGLAMLVQGVLQQDPFSGHLFVFRGAGRPTSSKSCTGMAPAFACFPGARRSLLHWRQTRMDKISQGQVLVCAILKESRSTRQRPTSFGAEFEP